MYPVVEHEFINTLWESAVSIYPPKIFWRVQCTNVPTKQSSSKAYFEVWIKNFWNYIIFTNLTRKEKIEKDRRKDASKLELTFVELPLKLFLVKSVVQKICIHKHTQISKFPTINLVRNGLMYVVNI